MWVNKQLFQMILEDNKDQGQQIRQWERSCHIYRTESSIAATQKTKDDSTIDWLRNRVNALEKERTVLLQKAAGIHLPTPEIEISKPRQVEVPNLDYMPSFEDVGDDEAQRLGIKHDEMGELVYTK